MKNRTKNIATSIIIIASLFIVNGCSDDYLDNTKVYAEDSESFFNSEADYYSALVAAYDPLQSTYINVLMGEIASNNTLCGGETATNVPGYQQVDDMIHSPVNSELQSLWSLMFGGVNRAAYIIEFQDKTDFIGKEIIIGEARFLRAYYNFELVKWFGAIPIKAEGRFGVGDEKTIPRSPKAEVYAFIEADLKYAVSNLSYTTPQVGRATKGSAEALLGKVYLYQDKFTEAAAVLEDVITKGPYMLETDYNKIFEAAGENGVGAVFEVQYTDVEGASFDCLQCSEGNVAVGFQGVRFTSGEHEPYTYGFSFNVPTQEMVDQFEAGDNRKEVAILDIDAFVEVRKQELLADSDPNNDDDFPRYTLGYEHTGFFNKKYIPRVRSANAAGDLNLTNPNNYRAIRFADVLLMASEANNRKSTPNDTKARLYLNRVRARAFGNTNNEITTGGTALTDAIYQERRVELVGEGHQFFDLVRTGRGTQIPGFSTNKNELFPIPIEEIQFSQGKWTQNKGYTN
ncbi:RagB/SusD family nutrient uptake outer membrane protein [Polaribacter sp. IC073]|uniref:RagB/SusD family nutrient uptake outer membrane protein n=1 Tax=Polaribacter sp. IC073 TaxID=2508540 RepID=UPI0011BD6098|nr:RagB/SusD family nutrient uptake outer membrane protein [Polaribacter sp. IC073]TXD47234.1 RagB/SusD family nutrient uptake outer membrane protein [Polaribacter sp. IC073]